MLRLHHRIAFVALLLTVGCASPPTQSTFPTTSPAIPATNVSSVAHVDAAPAGVDTLTIDGKTYQLTLVPAGTQSDPKVISAAHRLPSKDEKTESIPAPKSTEAKHSTASLKSPTATEPLSELSLGDAPSAVDALPTPEMTETVESAPSLPVAASSVGLNLPSVLASIDCRHPVIGFAQWRVRQAYAELAQAEALWLPSIQAGVSFHRHDGNYQASNGDIVDVNRNSFQYGLGTGATGAGTTQRPGIVARFHLADAIFQPKVLEKRVWARGHAAGAALNRQLLEAGQAYVELLAAFQDQRIVQESQTRLAELSKLTGDLAEAGEGLESDAERMRTELALIENRAIATEERVAVSSARLAQSISLTSVTPIVPMDENAVPLHLVSLDSDPSSLVATALATRPELKESQALVAAACDAYKRERLAPFIPSVLLGFSGGGFGGGLGDDLDNIGDRYDFDALMSWEVRNLGFGERAARRQRSAQVQQAKYEKLRILDQVARETTEALAQVTHRYRQIHVTKGAIVTARQSYEKNLERIRDGLGLPLEVLQSADALERAERAYLVSITNYNRAQLQLQWSLGWTVTGVGL
ncbi:MAG: TolC family protein [Planctomycetota bacterium]